jgi:hypothetical protein
MFHCVESYNLKRLKHILGVGLITSALSSVTRQQRPFSYIHILGLKGLTIPDFKQALLIFKQIPHLSNLLLDVCCDSGDEVLPDSRFDGLCFPNITCLSLAVTETTFARVKSTPIPIQPFISCFPSVKHLSVDMFCLEPDDNVLEPSAPPPQLVSLRSRSHVQESLLMWIIDQGAHGSTLRHLDIHHYYDYFITNLAMHCGDTLESLSLLFDLFGNDILPLSRFSALRHLSTGNVSIEYVALEEIRSEQLRRFEFFLPTNGDLPVTLSRLLAFLDRCPVLAAITCHYTSEPIAEIDAWADQRGIDVDWRRKERMTEWWSGVSRITCIVYSLLTGLSFTGG